MSTTVSNALLALGLDGNPTTEQIREAYLLMVRQFPPDREPERFREIHAAYQNLSDPLLQAREMLQPPRGRIDLMDLIENLSKSKARFPVDQLLALGNVD